jgi:predicted phosphodiesterase
MRVLVISDVHSNITALDAVLAAAGTVDVVWHLGDIVGYGPDPDAVVARLREVGSIGVRGNHDAAAVGGNEIDWFNTDARRAMLWTREAMGSATVAWLRDQPETRVVGEFTLVHGSPRDPLWEYILSRDVARANIEVLETRHGLHGHTHVPIAWASVGGRIGLTQPLDGEAVRVGDAQSLLNPGSVGQPRDGIPSASWMILDTDAAIASWHRVDYDIGAVQERMRTAGLPARLIERLSFGL